MGNNWKVHTPQNCYKDLELFTKPNPKFVEKGPWTGPGVGKIKILRVHVQFEVWLSSLTVSEREADYLNDCLPMI